MKILRFLLAISIIILLSSCLKKDETVTLILKQYNINNMNNNQPNVFVNHHMPLLIKSYDAYISNIDPHYSTHEADYFYKEVYFENNSLLIIPVLDHKMPEYSIDSYLFEHQHLDVMIKKTIPIERTQEYGYLDSIVHLLIEIDTTYVESFSFNFKEEKFYAFESFVLNQQDYDIPLGINVYRDYETFSSIFTNVAVYPFRGEDVLNNFNQSLFNDYYLLSYYKEDVTSGHFLEVEDIYLNTTPQNKLTYILGLKGKSTSAHLSHVLIIIMIDKLTLIDNDTQHVAILIE